VLLGEFITWALTKPEVVRARYQQPTSGLVEKYSVTSGRAVKLRANYCEACVKTVLWPVHTGNYSRPIRRLSPKPATVAVFGDSRRIWQQSPVLATVAELGDKLSPKSATIVSSVDRPLDVKYSVARKTRKFGCRACALSTSVFGHNELGLEN